MTDAAKSSPLPSSGAVQNLVVVGQKMCAYVRDPVFNGQSRSSEINAVQLNHSSHLYSKTRCTFY